MLDGSAANIGNVENNNPGSLLSGGDGVKARLKKGGRKLRPKAPRHGPNIRLTDHNNNNNATTNKNNNNTSSSTLTASSANKPAAQPADTEPLTLHHLKQGAKKEVTVCLLLLLLCLVP